MLKRSSLFVDTSGWACLLNRNDPLHPSMRTIYEGAIKRKRTIVTTNLVLTELVPLLETRAKHITRVEILAYVDALRVAPFISIMHVDEQLDSDAWDTRKRYQDKKWSVVDAASFVVMRRHGITEALTTNHHFEQAGFARVPQA